MYLCCKIFIYLNYIAVTLPDDLIILWTHTTHTKDMYQLYWNLLKEVKLFENVTERNYMYLVTQLYSHMQDLFFKATKELPLYTNC